MNMNSGLAAVVYGKISGSEITLTAAKSAKIEE
jgi:hypothetical protein